MPYDKKQKLKIKKHVNEKTFYRKNLYYAFF